MAFGVCTKCFFCAVFGLYSSKTENFAKTFDIVTTHNDELCYVKHAPPPPGPRGHSVPGPAAAAALQPLPLGRRRGLPLGGCHPHPATPLAGGPAGVAVARGLRLGLGQVGKGVGLDAEPAEVSWAQLALDYEAFAGRALPASPEHRLRGTRLPLGERAQIVRKAARVVERHLLAGTLLCGAHVGRCRCLLPLEGRVCAGLSARPFFAARHEVTLQLMRPATHCRDAGVRRLRAPARMRSPLGDRFLVDYNILRTKQNTIQAYCGSSLLYHTPQRRYDAIDTHVVQWVGGRASCHSGRAGGLPKANFTKTIWNK